MRGRDYRIIDLDLGDLPPLYVRPLRTVKMRPPSAAFNVEPKKSPLRSGHSMPAIAGGAKREPPVKPTTVTLCDAYAARPRNERERLESDIARLRTRLWSEPSERAELEQEIEQLERRLAALTEGRR
jgi:hypothetical protein